MSGRVFAAAAGAWVVFALPTAPLAPLWCAVPAAATDRPAAGCDRVHHADELEERAG